MRLSAVPPIISRLISKLHRTWRFVSLQIDRISENIKTPLRVEDEQILNFQPERHYEVVLLTMVYNCEKFIERFISEVSPIVNGMIFLDDGSTDTTYERLSGEKVLFKIRAERGSSMLFLERRNLEFLYQQLKKKRVSCSWVIWLDADELPRHDDVSWNSLIEKLRHSSNPDTVVAFPFVHLLDDEEHYWGNYPQTNRGVFFRSRMFRYNPARPFWGLGKSRHPSHIPFKYRKTDIIQSSLLIKHFGNISRNDRERRYHRYRFNDPQNRYQQIGYDHLQTAEDHIEKLSLNALELKGVSKAPHADKR